METSEMASGMSKACPVEAGPGARRILLVEDNVVNQLVAVKLLDKHGYRVTIACDGQQALDQLEAEPYDLVLMDLHMPVMDGFEATAAIRRREREGSRIPIIALTANTVKGIRERCLASGFDEFLTKPVRWSSLGEAIDRCIGPHAFLEASDQSCGDPEEVG